MDVLHTEMKTKELPHFLAMSKCHKEGIKIYPKPVGNQYKIIVDYKGKIINGNKLYPKIARKGSKEEEWWEAIYRLYEKYANQ